MRGGISEKLMRVISLCYATDTYIIYTKAHTNVELEEFKGKKKLERLSTIRNPQLDKIKLIYNFAINYVTRTGNR